VGVYLMVVNAVIVAAGKGERMGTVLPKPFLPVAGVPLLVHTLRSLDKSPLVRTIVLVIAVERELFCQDLLKQYGPFHARIVLVHGGPERQDSVRLGLVALDPECDIVVIHDAARPFISTDVLERSIMVAAEYGGALVAIPARDTIKRVNQEHVVTETVPRHDLWLAQTPQTFRVSLIRAAHARAQALGVTVTDDAALLEWAGEKVKIVPGDARNFKITTPEDLQLAEALLKPSLKDGD
jgi:2-C-methyl-D-erythritol 4-phosphate cytidylyltransferase